MCFCFLYNSSLKASSFWEEISEMSQKYSDFHVKCEVPDMFVRS